MTATPYFDRLERVKAYIYDHLDEAIDLNRLAEVACLSPHHWHRVYTAIEGETIAATVRRLRLHRAAGHLANGDEPVETVAKQAGYGSAAAFTRAFAETYGMPPAQYRREGSHRVFKTPGKIARNAHSPAALAVRVVELPEQRLLAVPHRGSYMEIGKAFDTLFRTLGARGLIGPEAQMLGVYHSDPSAVPEAALRAHAGLVSDAPAEPPLEALVLRGGRYAMLCHRGPYADMRSAYDWLYGQWLPQSGREPADAPVLERYLNTPQDTPPTELLTEIYLPLR